MLSARRLAKHACFARFAAVPGWVLDVLGGLRRLARALLLQCWLGLRSHLRGLSARSRLHESFTNLWQALCSCIVWVRPLLLNILARLVWVTPLLDMLARPCIPPMSG